MNGREWLARRMDREGLRYCRQDNCFPGSRICPELSIYAMSNSR
jgi:hypothetical protein